MSTYVATGRATFISSPPRDPRPHEGAQVWAAASSLTTTPEMSDGWPRL